MAPESRFPSGCRRFLSQLDELVDGPLSPDARSHQEQCASCATRLKAARRHAVLLRGLEAPVVPEQVRAPAFLEGIYERANASYEQDLGDALRVSLGPVVAPGDAAWVDDGSAALGSSLRSAFEGARTPGWMWRRIRARIEAEQVERQTRRVVPARLALVAAAILVSGILLFENPFASAPERGAYPLIPVVFQTSETPFESGLSLDQLAEVGR